MEGLSLGLHPKYVQCDGLEPGARERTTHVGLDWVLVLEWTDTLRLMADGAAQAIFTQLQPAAAAAESFIGFSFHPLATLCLKSFCTLQKLSGTSHIYA